MKSKLFILFVLLTFQLAAAKDGGLTVKAQLENLNKYWKSQNLEDPILTKTIKLRDEVSLIQMHLSLVEKTLREKSSAHLSKKQIKNRIRCLDILHSYWSSAVFPKNLYHKSRTPYFIDKFGTNCAVGQLIVSTGLGDLVQKISRENNNAYVAELFVIYPELKEWANNFGFTVEELAWIQPCYCVASGPATINPSCPGRYTGYFMPDISNLPAPCTYYSSRWDGANWIPKYFNCAACDLPAGSYKMTVKDGPGNTYEFYATLVDPPPATISVVTAGDYKNCAATATALASGVNPPFSYVYPSALFVDNVASGLCEQMYRVIATDKKGCDYSQEFGLGDPLALKEFSYEQVSISPNPFQDAFQVQLSDFFEQGQTIIYLYDFSGKLLDQFEMNSSHASFATDGLKPGIYFLRINNAKNTVSVKIVKDL